MKYQMDQEVWWARYEQRPDSIPCPDCAGTGYITCIMGDGAEVTVDCQNCQVGYEEFARGRVTIYQREPVAVKTRIIGMDVKADSVEYRVPESYIVTEGVLFETESEALAKAKELADEASRAELEKVSRKEKDTRSWSWNATYHRREIKSAERRIEYHTRKLNVAKEMAKRNSTA